MFPFIQPKHGHTVHDTGPLPSQPPHIQSFILSLHPLKN